MLQKSSEQDWNRRMGGEEMEDSGFSVEEEAEVMLDSGFCMNPEDSELFKAEQMIVCSVECEEKEEFVIIGCTDFPERRKENAGGDGEGRTQGVENRETDDLTEGSEEENVEAGLDVCSVPGEENGGLVRISLEEVERYYRFSRRCHWLCDEIMQLDSSPLRAADITPDLKKQFAFLSGGRGDNGSPIIVFPEFPAFGEITDREFHNVLTYLTSVP
uniref:MCF2L n=2 Tax=Amphiprion ocellaris TaxID=80972 RepID=A0AAQ5ZR90_AMPOC